jgi:phage baseplate assembly protein W
MARVFSQEDGNLNVQPITTSRTKAYSDIDLTFAKKASGDVFKKTDAAAVKQSVKNLLLTNRNEKPFDPNFGGNLDRFLFSLDEEFEEEDIEDAIAYAIHAHEPRAIFRGAQAKINSDQNSIAIAVRFQVKSTLELVDLNISLTRLR